MQNQESESTLTKPKIAAEPGLSTTTNGPARCVTASPLGLGCLLMTFNRRRCLLPENSPRLTIKDAQERVAVLNILKNNIGNVLYSVVFIFLPFYIPSGIGCYKLHISCTGIKRLPIPAFR